MGGGERSKMHDVPWYLVLAISVPQAMLMIYIGFSLCNIKIDLARCTFCAGTISVISQLVRSMSISLAAITLILTILLVLITALVFRIHVGKALVACLLGVMLSGVIEGAVIQSFLIISGYSAEELMSDAILNLIGYIPVFTVTLIVYGLIRRVHFVAFDLSEVR